MAGGEASTFGALLRRYRQAAGLSQEALAERAGRSAVAISALERGVRRAPYLDTVEMLARALELDASDRAAFLAAARPPSSGHAFPGADALVPMVGRGGELALLDTFLAGETTAAGSPPVLIFAGEPGIGKTRLLQAAAERGVAGGWCVLAAGCQRREGQEPYAPVLDALAQYLQAMEWARLRSALRGCGWLVRLLPELEADLEPVLLGTLAAEQERRLMYAAVARVLSNLAGPAGTLLVLDDLQWAGADALDLLSALLRTGTPLRIIGAYRDTELRPLDPLGLLVADLAQARRLRWHTVGPLSRDEAADLLAHLVDDPAMQDRGVIEGALQRAEGTPFFLISLAQELSRGSGVAVPWDIALGVRQRVALLPADCREFLDVAAVMGRHVAREPLEAAAGVEEEAVLAGLEAACRARLLVEDEDGGYAFAHDLIREVLEGDLGAARRSRLHRRVAEVLERHPETVSLETLAHHWTLGGAHDQAALCLEEAGDQARAEYAHAAAEQSYRSAIELLDGLGQAEAAVRVREKLGGVLRAAGRYGEALSSLEQAADTYRMSRDVEGETRVTALLAQAHAQGGAPETGLARINALLARLEARDSLPGLAALYGVFANLLLTTGRYAESLTVSQRAAELARDSGDDRAHIVAEFSRMHVLLKLDRMDEAVRLASEVLQLAEGLGDLRMLAVIHRDLAYILAAHGEFDTARSHIDRACVAARQVEGPWELVLAIAVRGWLAFLRGEWREARADLEQAVAASYRDDLSWCATYSLLFLAHLCLREGDWPAAAAAGNQALELASQSGDLQGLRWVAPVMAELDLQRGRVDAVLERLLPLIDRPGLEEGDVTDFMPLLALAYLEQGQIDQAGDVVVRALSRARVERARPVLTEALRVQAIVAVQQRELEVACRSLEEGLDLARSMPYPYAEARLLYVVGLLRAEQGAPNLAREAWDQALARFTHLGARADAARTEEAIGTLRPPDPPHESAYR